MPRAKFLESTAAIPLRADGSLTLGVVADTHSELHPKALGHLRALAPDAILHAGDIGDLQVLDQLGTVAPVFAVRGNIDVRLAELPDVLVLDVTASTTSETAVRILMMHIAVNGPRLRADALRLATAHDASLVVCGHSHVPLIARAQTQTQTRNGAAIFNPGSIGPRRFRLPIVFGQISISPTGVRLTHHDAETGRAWSPRVTRESSARIDDDSPRSR